VQTSVIYFISPFWGSNCKV